MVHIRSMADLDAIRDDPELYREVLAYLLYCRHEYLEYGDEADLADHDFGFAILEEEDLPMLNDMLRVLGPPEEWVSIAVHADDQVSTIIRIVYPTAVLFIPSEISDQVTV